MFSRSSILQVLSRTCSTPQVPTSTLRSTSRSWSSPSVLHAPLLRSLAQRASSGRSKPLSPLKLPDLDEVTLRFAGRRPEGFGRLERKVAKRGNIVLFKAPSQRSYVLGAHGVATFCFAYAVYNSYITFRDPKVPLPAWQKTLFGGICVIMSVMGTVFLFKTSRLVKTLTAVNLGGRTYLRFAVRSMIPFHKPWVFDASPRQVAFARQLVASPHRITHGGQAKIYDREPVSESSFFKAPLKRLSFGFWRVFLSVRRLFTQEDFIFLDVEGRKGSFRMDLNGYLSDDLLFVGDPVNARPS